MFSNIKWLGCLLPMIMLVACSDEVRFESSTQSLTINDNEDNLNNDDSTNQTLSFSEKLKQQVEKKQVDILVIVDNSASMLEEQAMFGSQLNSFLSHISEADWQLGVVTTDVGASPRPGFAGELDVFSELGNRRYLRHDDANKEQLFLDMVNREDNCGDDVDQICTSNSEQPLRALIETVNKRERANTGFFRPDADLVVLMISDEDEMSIGGSAATKPDEVVNHLKFVFPDKEITVYGVVIEPGDQACLDENLAKNSAAFGTHVSELSQKTNGLTFSLCSTNYGQELMAVSGHMKKKLLFDSMTLQFNPVPQSIVVNFTPATDINWELVDGRKIVFETKPPEGTEVEVKYEYQVLAP